MKIKISESNKEKIETALAAINGKAESFAVTTLSEVESVAKRAERKLADIAKVRRVGATATYRPAGPTANSYKYAAKSTFLRIERFSTGWFLVFVGSATVNPKQGAIDWVEISTEQADETIKNRGMTIRQELAA